MRKNPRRKPSALRHTRKANTPKRSRMWSHVYNSARKEGFKEGDAIAIADGVLKKRVNKVSRARKNPRVFGRKGKSAHRHLREAYAIEGLQISGTKIKTWYFNGNGFSDHEAKAERFQSRAAAHRQAAHIRYSLPAKIRTLRVYKI
ncbi:MAG: hypothetical protein KGJ13_05015 [Patescibacteria group bacterium]|nr:hypothetical protein [Patescibacteria group bacterium]